MHIVLAGLNYQPRRAAGDKNFWTELIPYLARKVRKITIFSIRQAAQEYEEWDEGGCSVSVRYFSPRFLETPDPQCGRQKIFWRHGAFPRWLGIIEKALDVSLICGELRKLHSESPFNFVHLMDNFGFGNRAIERSVHSGISVSAIAYQGKMGPLYDYYLAGSYICPRLTVVPYSLTYYNKLLGLGVGKDQIVHIPWGTSIRNCRPCPEERESIKRSLGLPGNAPLVFWAGYIQQIRREDFLFAVRTAEESLRKKFGGIFCFAFKPESFDKKLMSFHDPGRGIYIKQTSVAEFSSLKRCADIFYSPVTGRNCIVAPPLTWIELLNSGVPILTTRVPGADEIVTDGETGYLAGSREELIEKLFVMAERYKEMVPGCLAKAAASYNIERTAEKYLNLWLN